MISQGLGEQERPKFDQELVEGRKLEEGPGGAAERFDESSEVVTMTSCCSWCLNSGCCMTTT
jgi:hypothetical protein